jgi:hypothetical protein
LTRAPKKHNEERIISLINSARETEFPHAKTKKRNGTFNLGHTDTKDNSY